MPSQNLTDAQIVDCTLAFCKKQEIDVSSSAVAISFQLLPTICAARANAKKAALTVTERKDAKAAGVTFDDPEENCAALIVNPSAGTLAAGYKATDSVAYKKGRFGDWNFEYSLNLGAASLMHAEVPYAAMCSETQLQYASFISASFISELCWLFIRLRLARVLLRLLSNPSVAQK